MVIIQTKPGDINFHLFSKVITSIYPPDHLRHQQEEDLNSEFLSCCLVVLVNEIPKARIAIYNNPNLNYNGARTFCIGNYECIDDNIVAKALFKAAIQLLKGYEAEYVLGPMNGSPWNNYRFSIHNNYPNFFIEPYNHTYYNKQFIDNGFNTIANYTSAIEKNFEFDNRVIIQQQIKFEVYGITIRQINLANYERELENIYSLIMEAFRTSFLYTPLSKPAFMKKYLKLKPRLKPEFILLAEDKNKELVGLFFGIDDYNTTFEKSLIVHIVARKNNKELSGLGNVMSYQIAETVKKKGYQSVIHAFIIEQGNSLALSKNFAGQTYKNYALYGLKL